MIKLAVIALLLLIGGLAIKYADEKSQKKITLGLIGVLVVYVITVVASELMR
ncbi:hypothetical protein ACFFLZ_02780 [Photobacterium aphoticum]|uniref:TetR family transcriptional regulator n=1 Tax=Photobacterium aphoticum TaxID=754436 RepID=A0A090QWF6_9GAMM|nr:hypothetical protein [Photobacterium aphoticum]KLV03098.1 TetR family transcriptional regulator [Photobacterium aphoticum]GAL06598.1 hypothetical protein JCM19237_2695 [Photobacterium aphoticum]GHA52096.1 hypothetical protein GCM10007086_27680 [Photobacterium aphoticum]